jgi:hypothetical protein
MPAYQDGEFFRLAPLAAGDKNGVIVDWPFLSIHWFRYLRQGLCSFWVSRIVQSNPRTLQADLTMGSGNAQRLNDLHCIRRAVSAGS